MMSGSVVPGIYPSGQQVRLAHGAQSAVVVEVGGGIRRYRVGGRDVLDGYRCDEMASAGRGQLLAPWPNRLADGRYRFDDVDHQCPLSEPERGNAIHGLARWASWAVVECGPASATLGHRLHPRPGYPFTVDLRVTYQLGPLGLEVALAATNRGEGPAPYGSGAHPYLRLGDGPVDDLELQCPAGACYDTDERGIPTGRRAVETTPFDFTRWRRIGDLRLDTAFGDLHAGSDGRTWVRLRRPGGDEVALWADRTTTHLMLFTGDTIADPDRRRRAVAVEPMTCAPNALRSGDGLRTLGPGETIVQRWGVLASWLDD